MYAHWCIGAVMCDVERLVFMALPAATANLGQPSANHIAGNHNQETSLVQISMSINIKINIYNNNNYYSLGSLILKGKEQWGHRAKNEIWS